MLSDDHQPHGPSYKQEKGVQGKGLDFSLVIPVYLNEENISDLLEALILLEKSLRGSLEVVFVVDGSPDHSYVLLQKALSSYPIPSQLIALSRNFGSFAAIRIGLEAARGKYAAVMAADLQEPPELIKSFFDVLQRDEADVAFGMRTGREDNFLYRWSSEIFWALYRRFVLSDVPKGGIDIFACNQYVKEAVLQITEPNSSLIAQLIWVGFRRKFIPYKRRKREKGKSAWKLRSRLRYMFDSLFSFSDLPIMLLLWIGGLGVGVSLVLVFVTLIARLTGHIKIPGYTNLILVQSLSASLLLLSQGIIGSYLWRTFENTKRRPLSLVRLHTYFDLGNSFIKQNDRGFL
ncbi:MAG: glycosyltransferase family 2 protein [Dissulfurispiraceae bacterium]